MQTMRDVVLHNKGEIYKIKVIITSLRNAYATGLIFPTDSSVGMSIPQ